MTSPGACRSSPTASPPTSRPTCSSSLGDTSRIGPRCSCSTDSPAKASSAASATTSSATACRSSAVAAPPSLARRTAASASDGSRATSGRNSRPWSLARAPSSANRRCDSVSALSNEVEVFDRRLRRGLQAIDPRVPGGRVTEQPVRAVGTERGDHRRSAPGGAAVGGEVVAGVVGGCDRPHVEVREQRLRRAGAAAGGSPPPRSRAPSTGRAEGRSRTLAAARGATRRTAGCGSAAGRWRPTPRTSPTDRRRP